MGARTIRSQRERGDENNIAGKNSYARGQNSSVDGKHISDFMGKQRGGLHLRAELQFSRYVAWRKSSATRGRSGCRDRQFREGKYVTDFV